METAAKKKNSLALGVIASMIAWVSACLLSSAATASSVSDVGPKTRAEIFLGVPSKSVEVLDVNPANATRCYDVFGGVVLECTVAPNRGLRIAKTDGNLSGTNTLGYTTANGDIFLQPGLTRAQQASTLRHEGVHSFLSVADDAPLGALRQRAGIGAYNNSAFFNATEEILAEGIASGSLRQGVRHAFNGAYKVRSGRVVTPLNFGFELGVGATGLGALGYGGYELGNWLFGDGE